MDIPRRKSLEGVHADLPGKVDEYERALARQVDLGKQQTGLESALRECNRQRTMNNADIARAKEALMLLLLPPPPPPVPPPPQRVEELR